MFKKEYPILEFDSSQEAVIEPTIIHKPIDIPDHCVICFFREVIDKLVAGGQAREIFQIKTEIGTHGVYQVELDGRRCALFHPGVGAPLAGAILEEVIALGGKKFIACGGAGVLDRVICVGHLLVPDTAVRDEGFSYHYLPPAREVTASPEGVAAIKKVLERHQCPYLVVKTWTTDAIFRETSAKVQLRKAEGCLSVEMECAAFFAVAQFRRVILAQILYGGDDVSCEKWDSRDWQVRTSIRENVFWLAVEACLEL